MIHRGEFLSRRVALTSGAAALAWPAFAAPSELADPCRPAADAMPPPFLAVYGSPPRLLFVASDHNLRPGGALARRIDAMLAARPDLLVVEGVHSASGLNSPSLVAQARQAHAEQRFSSETMYAAAEALDRNVPVLGAQPDDRWITQQQVARGFAPDDVFGAVVLAQCRALRLSRPNLPFDDVARRVQTSVQDTYARWLRIEAFDLPAWYRSRYGIAPEADPALSERGSPCGEDLVARITRTATDLRNEHLLALIERLATPRARLGVVQGAGHFHALSPALRRRFGRPAFG